LRYQHTQAIRATFAERNSASTANRHLSALRGVLKDAWRLGYMTAEDYCQLFLRSGQCGGNPCGSAACRAAARMSSFQAPNSNPTG